MRKNLFLYLALACLLGILTVFIVDGYLGIYDTVYVTIGENTQKIATDFWQQGGTVFVSPPVPVPMRGDQNAYYRGDQNAYNLYANQGEKVTFGYIVENRSLASYTADIEVSVWRSQQKVQDVTSQVMLIAPFAQGEMKKWELNMAELKPSGITAEQGYQFSVVIKRGGIERRIVVNINPLPSPAKPF